MPGPIIKNQILRRLTAADFSALQPHLQQVPLEVRQELVTPGVPITHVYFPESGIASLVVGQDGSESIEVGHVGWEGMTDHVIEVGDTSRLRCFVQSPGTAWAVPASDYARWVSERPSALRLVLRFNQYMSVQLAYTALSHGSFTIQERLARWLLMCFDRTQGDDLPYVHEFIGLMLAVRRSGVTNAMHVLEGEGAIKARRARIQLRDRETLINLAAGSYGGPEEEYLRLMGPLPMA
jgi:CRP-like cAMP-binding protein